ncbi:MAG: hypothetical protein M1818_001511 [Claussenomyces sp. TS43310]|nr:MAG: hypothetical protein M1818_001511 [Claussenomyces sp. TS43310]
MRPRTPRFLILLPPRRFFSRQSRPQLPFLSQPHAKRQARWITTERKQWVRSELWRAGKYTTILWTFTLLSLVAAFGVQQEYLERRFPSPHEWPFTIRKDYRSARWNEDNGEGVDWARTAEAYSRLIRRLEAELQDQLEGGILVAGVGKTGFDIEKKSEPWRRGYHDCLMGAARAAEHLDGWVRDRTRNIAFPANTVIGPSNPNPRPVPPGAKTPPREENCEAAFDPPQTYYMRVLTTKGFTERQKLEAALGYAAWLEYKGTPEAAFEMYKWALDISGSETSTDGLPSANTLMAATALAVHHARNDNLSTALPIFLSVLRARRSLPQDDQAMLSARASLDETSKGFFANLTSMVRSAIKPPSYPPPPDTGTTAPTRNSEERCQEAGIMTYIGEILYASSNTNAGREDGLAWTREAVDLAEEELRGRAASASNVAKQTCRECLETGLGNWAKMVSKLSREEREGKTTTTKVGGWLGFGGHEQEQAVKGRWESEESVVQERTKRARDVLSTPVAGRSSSSILFV